MSNTTGSSLKKFPSAVNDAGDLAGRFLPAAAAHRKHFIGGEAQPKDLVCRSGGDALGAHRDFETVRPFLDRHGPLRRCQSHTGHH